MKCSYCSSEIERGTGFAYVRKSGVVRYFCTNRCYKLNLVQDRKLKGRAARQ